MISSIGQIGSSAASGIADVSKSAPSASPEASFAQVLADMASNTVGSVKAADNMAVQGIMGKADTREVVDAVMKAEQALQASIAIRDKIVTAYLETTRMAI